MVTNLHRRRHVYWILNAKQFAKLWMLWRWTNAHVSNDVYSFFHSHIKAFLIRHLFFIYLIRETFSDQYVRTVPGHANLYQNAYRTMFYSLIGEKVFMRYTLITFSVSENSSTETNFIIIISFLLQFGATSNGDI